MLANFNKGPRNMLEGINIIIEHDEIHQISHALADLDKPVIASINGVAVGAAVVEQQQIPLLDGGQLALHLPPSPAALVEARRGQVPGALDAPGAPEALPPGGTSPG